MQKQNEQSKKEINPTGILARFEMENSTNSDFEPMIHIHKLVGSGVKHYTTAIQKKKSYHHSWHGRKWKIPLKLKECCKECILR